MEGQHVVVGTPGRVFDMISQRALGQYLEGGYPWAWTKCSTCCFPAPHLTKPICKFRVIEENIRCRH